MKYDPDKHHRRSIRLKGYDYASPGAYFVTICTQHGKCLFGEIVDGQVNLNEAGQMIQDTWEQLPKRFPIIDLDAYIVMPNHFHAIVIIRASREGEAPLKSTEKTDSRPALGDIIGTFKSITTNKYICGVRESGWPRFDKRVWQRNYWEHIIRNDRSLNRIRQYVNTNPSRWAEDQLHPEAPANPFRPAAS